MRICGNRSSFRDGRADLPEKLAFERPPHADQRGRHGRLRFQVRRFKAAESCRPAGGDCRATGRQRNQLPFFGNAVDSKLLLCKTAAGRAHPAHCGYAAECNRYAERHAADHAVDSLYDYACFTLFLALCRKDHRPADQRAGYEQPAWQCNL